MLALPVTIIHNAITEAKGAEEKQTVMKMVTSYETKEQAQQAAEALNCGDCFSAVYVSSAYAKFDGVEGNKWYVFSNVSKKIV